MTQHAPRAPAACVELLIAGKAVDHLLDTFDSLSVETGNQQVLLNKGHTTETVLAAHVGVEWMLFQ